MFSPLFYTKLLLNIGKNKIENFLKYFRKTLALYGECDYNIRRCDCAMMWNVAADLTGRELSRSMSDFKPGDRVLV